MSATVNLKITPESFDTISECLRLEAERLQNGIEDLTKPQGASYSEDETEAWKFLVGRQQQAYSAARDIGRPITVKGVPQ